MRVYGPISPGQKKKMRETHLRKSPEEIAAWKKKLSLALKGRKKSAETRRRMSLAQRGHYQRPMTAEEKQYLSRYWKGKRSGKNNPCWRGGRTPLQHLIRCTGAHKIWRGDVFERDEYTCQDCGQGGGRLEAHHKKSFVSILIKYNIKTVEEALKCDALWDVSNGLTLCKKCHDKTKKGKPKKGVRRKEYV